MSEPLEDYGEVCDYCGAASAPGEMHTQAPSGKLACPRCFTSALVLEASGVAMRAHGDQKYGDQPYVQAHVCDVVRVLIEFGCTDPETVAAGYLHDVVEDTPVTLEELGSMFSPGIVAIVDGVTSMPGKNRRERNAATYPKTRANHRSVRVKLADRISNVRSAQKTNAGLFDMYRKEYPSFRAALWYENEELAAMWAALDGLFSFSG